MDNFVYFLSPGDIVPAGAQDMDNSVYFPLTWRHTSSRSSGHGQPSFFFLLPGGILPAGAQVMDAAALVAVPDAGDELAELGPDDPEAEPVPLAGEVVDEQRVPPVPTVHLVQNGRLVFAYTTSH